MDKINLNELYTEEGFDVLDFNTFSLLERHGVLSGENSCSKFASHLLDFIEELNKKGIEFGEFIVHSNENCLHHQEYIDKGIPDLSTDGWDLPAWASWELMIHIGVLEDDDNKKGALQIIEDDLEAHIGLQSPEKILSDRQDSSVTIQHEMKHYFDSVIEFNKKGKINNKVYQEINKLFKKEDEMYKIGEDGEKNIIHFFTYFFYITSEAEMSAWLENTRDDGYIHRWLLLRGKSHAKNARMSYRYSTYKKILENILHWKEGKLQSNKINPSYDIIGTSYFSTHNFKTYDEFKKFMMENFGSYLESRFGKKESFEKYMKRYIKILDKQIKKHSKIWADGFNGIDLDETPEDIEKILIKKRKERLERIRKKKEGKN